MAVLVLVLEGDVNWNYGVPMAIGGLVGGYIGGMVSHRANRTVVRSIVIAIGFAASAYYLWKLYGQALWLRSLTEIRRREASSSSEV